MRAAPIVFVALVGCTGAAPALDGGTAPGDVAHADTPGDTTPDAGGTGLEGRTCGALGEWATPLTDYIAAGEAAVANGRFMRGVHDLAVFEDRLYVGYGDADVNLGRVIPIEVRAFRSDEAPTATAETATAEEQVEQFRSLDDGLWIAGVDATEDAWLGNVYRRAAGQWVKLRTVGNGVHVHDVAAWGGAVWAVGSGGTPDEWNARDIYGHLWRSGDRGASFTVAARHHNQRMGDARWVRILPVSDGLLLFGYRTDNTGRASIVNARFNGTEAQPLAEGDPLRTSFVVETLLLPGGGGIARGAVNNPAGAGLVHRSHRVDALGRATVVTALEGRAVLDMAAVGTSGEVVVLSADHGEWGRDRPDWSMRVDVTRDFVTLHTLAAFHTVDAVRAVSVWRGRLYVGRDDGTVLRCDLQPR